MATVVEIAPSTERELVLCRIIEAPKDKLYRCWTEPELLKQFFCPKPWTVPEASLDVRPGGETRFVMRSPEGEENALAGVYLEVVPNEKLVTTDAFTAGWVPTEKPFMVATVTFEDAGEGRTRYTARCGHWSVEDKETHEKMGFHEGWGVVAQQMEDLARTL